MEKWKEKICVLASPFKLIKQKKWRTKKNHCEQLALTRNKEKTSTHTRIQKKIVLIGKSFQTDLAIPFDARLFYAAVDWDV